MQSYIEASRFPLVDIAGRQIPRVILGQHPYDGTTYTSWERDQTFRTRWTSPQSMVELLKPIVQRFGLTATREVPTDTALSRWHQEAVRLTMKELDMEIALVLGTTLPTTSQPDSTPLLLQRSYALAGDVFTNIWCHDPITQYRFLERRQLKQEDIVAFARQAIDTVTQPEPCDFDVDYPKLDAMLQRYTNFTIPLYASNAAFELLVLTERFDELQRLVDTIRQRIGVFLLGTHYAGTIIPRVEAAGIEVDGYLTPINAAGIAMFPTARHVVDAIRNAGKPVIAIKPLGGGRIPPNEAFHYLFHDLKIPAVMVGVGSMAEAEETFHAATEALTI